MNFILLAAQAFITPPVSAMMWYVIIRLPILNSWLQAAIFCTAFGFGAQLCGHDDGWLAGSAASLAVALAIWFWRSRHRKRAAKLLGAKGRALRAALVRKAREAARPRPVLRPVPGAA